MIKKITYLLVLLMSASLVVAQNNAIFNGGAADGYNGDCYQQSVPNTVDFTGGNDDGYAKDCYVQTMPQTVAFGGGNDDGHAKDCYMQMMPQTVAFGGGNDDGHAKDCYMQTIPQTISFNGGVGGDGQLNGCANEPLGCFLTVNLGNDTIFCESQTLTLDAGIFAGGATTYLWQDGSTTQTFLADTSGLYYVFVTDAFGCSGSDSINITVNPIPVVNLGNDTAFCAGNNLTLDAGAGSSSYQWMNGNTSPYLQQTFTVNSTGTYFVAATIGVCTTRDTINVTVNPNQTTYLPDSIICAGDSALIFGNYETIAGTYYHTLNTYLNCDSVLVQRLIVHPTYNQNLGTITICQGDSAMIFGNYETVAGIYYDSTQSIITGCDSIVRQTLNVSPAHLFSLGNDTAFCAGGNLTLDAGAGANSYQWMNGSTSPFFQQTFTINATGTYFVVATIGACTTRDTINITVNPHRITNLPDSVICQGDSALIFGNYQTVAGTYYDTLDTYLNCDSILVQQLIVYPTYNQNLGTISICAGDSALIFGNYEMVAGTYYDSTQSLITGCDSIVRQTLAVLSNSSVNLGSDTAICQGQNITLDAGAGGSSYQWMNGSTLPYLQQTFTVNATGTYFVEVITGSCSAADTINITVNPNQTTFLPDSIICQGDSALIFGNYETVAGTYYDTLNTYLNCDSVLVQQLVVNPTYNYSLSTISICSGDSALIFGNYETTAGIYYDSIQSLVTGCDSIVSQTLNIDPTPVVNLGNDTTFCSGNNLTLDAGSGATSYLWMNNAVPSHQNQTYTVNSTGTYFVTATIGICSATDSIGVTVIQPVFTNLADSIICQGDSALIFGNYETVAGNYYDTLPSMVTGCDSILVQQLVVNPTYNYSLGTISICTGDSALIFGNYETVAGIYYDSTQSVVTGCDSIVSQTLNIDPTPVVNLGNDTTFCSGNNLTLDAGSGATSYLWMNNAVPSHQNQTFTVNSTGTYFVTATIGVCSASDSIDVTVIQPVFTNLADVNICSGDSILIFGNYETIAGTYYDTLMSSLTMCDSILVQQLYVNPNVTTNDSIAICVGDSVFLAGAYQNTAGIYYDTLQTASSCDSVIITQLTLVNGFTVNASDTICEGESLFVGGSEQTISGIYYDTLQSINGCDSIIITTLLVTPKPTVIVTAQPNFVVSGEPSQINATGGGTYSWTPSSTLTCSDCANPVASPTETTTYTVTVDSNSCVVSDTITVTVEDQFFIPEGFSPNGDGVNDVFEIVGIAKYPNNTITIINRWGSKVFEAAPYQSDWNGTNHFGISFGEKLPTGTYFYILDLGNEGPNGDQVIKGYIYLNE